MGQRNLLLACPFSWNLKMTVIRKFKNVIAFLFISTRFKNREDFPIERMMWADNPDFMKC
jgi:hypothetical protein